MSEFIHRRPLKREQLSEELSETGQSPLETSQSADLAVPVEHQSAVPAVGDLSQGEAGAGRKPKGSPTETAVGIFKSRYKPGRLIPGINPIGYPPKRRP